MGILSEKANCMTDTNITYTEPKQRVYNEFNSTLLNFISKIVRVSSPNSRDRWCLPRNCKLDFETINLGNSPKRVDIYLDFAPIATIRELNLNGKAGLYFIKATNIRRVNGILQFENPTPLSEDVISSLNQLIKSLSRLPKKCDSVKFNSLYAYVSSTDLQYYFSTDEGVVVYSSLKGVSRCQK